MAESPKQERAKGQVKDTLVSALNRRLAGMTGISALIAIVGVVAVVIGLVVLILSADLEGWALSTMALGGILLLVALIASLGTVVHAVTGKRGRYGLNSFIMIVAFAVIIALISVIAFRNQGQKDLTATRQFTLADRTADLLRDLPEPVQALAFFTPNNPAQEQLRRAADDLLGEFERRSGNFSYRFVDPDRDPNTARTYGISQYPTIAFVGQESLRLSHLLAPRFQERDFVTAMLIVTGTLQKNIYVITGHGERDVTVPAEEPTGFTFALEGLQNDNYALQTLSLREKDEIPTLENVERLELTPEDAAAAIVIAGPTQELEEKEFEILFTYLKNGGRAIFLLDPDPPESFKELLGKWGVMVNDGLVIDERGMVSGQPQTPLIPRDRYIDSIPSITGTLDEVFLPGATSFDYAGLYNIPGFRTRFDPENDLPPLNITYAPLAGTTLLSCTTQHPDAENCGGNATFGGNLLPGMAVIALAPIDEEPDPETSEKTKIVILGDSDLVTNRYFYSGSNSDLFLNSVNWLTEDVDLSSVRPKPATFRLLVLTKPEMRFIQYSSWLLLPVAILLLGFVAWWRRR